MTAQQIIDRIQQNVGVPWQTSTVDGLVAGSPDTPIQAIATTFAPSVDVLRKAVDTGKNMIISRESAFYEHSRRMAPADKETLARNATRAAKEEFIARNKLVIWRFSDHWQARQLNGQTQGLAKALGWKKGQANDRVFVLPQTSLRDLAVAIRDRMKVRAMRIIGDPQAKVSKVALAPGMILVPGLRKVLEEPGVDVVVTGEPVEWEAAPYFQDVVASGQKKGMIMLGLEVSEEPGSGEVASWLKTVVPDVPIDWIPAGEPFWMLKGAPR